jgi:hypothetical protein
MPNWCTTNVIITGEPQNELNRLVSAIGVDFDFNRLIPIPEELRDTEADDHREYRVYHGNGSDEAGFETLRAELDRDRRNRDKADRDKALLDKYGAYDWYEWCWKNWGTKWSACEVAIQTDCNGIAIVFDSAWGFPKPIFQQLSEMFPSLYFIGHAVEHNMGWTFNFEASDGLLAIHKLDYDEEYPSRDDENDEEYLPRDEENDKYLTNKYPSTLATIIRHWCHNPLA